VLPVPNLASSIVDVAGTSVSIRSLSRMEVLHIRTFEDREEEAEVFILSRSTGQTEDEAKAFLEGHDSDTAEVLLNAVFVLSGLREAAGSKA